MATLKTADYRVMVNGCDVTMTIDPDKYYSAIASGGEERRRKLYQEARAQADKDGATAHILANGATMVQFWDERFNTVATTQSALQNVSDADFDVTLWGWKDGGALIFDHRLETA